MIILLLQYLLCHLLSYTNLSRKKFKKLVWNIVLELSILPTDVFGSMTITSRLSWSTIRALAIDMETATIFSVGIANEISRGALLLVSDVPMTPDGVKTEESDKKVSQNFVDFISKLE